MPPALSAVRVVGSLAVFVELFPRAERAHLAWVAPDAWGEGHVRGPGWGTDGPVGAWGAWVDGVLARLRSASGAADLVALGDRAGAWGYLPDYVCARPQPIPQAARAFKDEALVRVLAAAGPDWAPAVALPVPFAPAPGAPPARWDYDRLCRGLTEGLAEALWHERAALGSEYLPLREAIDALRDGARARRGWTPARRDARRTELLEALEARWRDGDAMPRAASLWHGAVVEGLGGLLIQARATPLAWARLPDARALVARVALARALRTEDAAEAFAWAESCLAGGLAVHAPPPESDPPRPGAV